jgi:S-adenosylmethionine-diacylglycerol 3-amino-3-carboxypropyl transferase
MSNDLKARVNFELIRYANCWEDADILLEGLSPAPGRKLLSIASAGDNSFSLLITNPELMVAVDVNKIQLYLVELKKVAIKKMDREDVLKFLGFRHCGNRGNMFDAIKDELSVAARIYWEKNSHLIANGVIYEGKFENYFKTFSGKILPWIHSKKTIEELFRIKTGEEQERFYHEKWNTRRWRLLFKLFFSKYIMGKFGRDPEFLKEVKVDVSKYIFEKAGKNLQKKAAQQNFFLYFNLTGTFGNFLPHYLREENFETIKSNIDRLVIREGYAQDAISEFGKFHYMNLSNIFEYMNPALFSETAEALIKGTEKGGRLAYWNLMVPRRISEILPGKAMHEQEIAAALAEKDKGFFYSQFIIETIK